MQFVLFYPDSVILEESDFGKVANVPVIFDRSWNYHQVGSRYLRVRASGEAIADDHRFNFRYPTPQSLETFARWLIDFLEWCDWAKIAWQDVSYRADLIDGYQTQMLSGAWSVNGSPLAASTVNHRISEACVFLSWAANSELRPDFKINFGQTYRVRGSLSSVGHKRDVINSRPGKIRESPMNLRIPTVIEIERWLKCVALEFGATKSLMCDLIIQTAIRREECCQWRTSYLPLDRRLWQISGEFAIIKLEFGTKGSKIFNGKELVGPSRYIRIPLALAERLRAYLEFEQPKCAMKFINVAKDLVERRRRFELVKQSGRLFLSEYDGCPIKGNSLWKAWTSSTIKPYSAWAPHLGRHYFACMSIFHDVHRRQKMMPAGFIASSDWIYEMGSGSLLILKKQLGHVSQSTTDIYLVWLMQAYGANEHHALYLEQE